MSISGFSTPWWFLLLVVAAALGVGYLLAQRARRKRTLRFANLELLDKVAPAARGRYRHIPAALLIGSLCLFTIAMSGPTADQKVPRNRATVVLVIDVSLSMESTDIAPTRIKAAQEAARSFAHNLTPGVNLGLVSFAGSATVLVSPTTQREGVVKAIDNLKLGPSTATGEGIFAALNSIEGFSAVVGGADGPPPARIVLMTDGKQTIPTDDPYDTRGAYVAAQTAKQQGIPISTISFGTQHGTVDIDGKPVKVPADDAAMEEIARLSGGQYFKAASADEIKRVYADLGEQLGYEIKNVDASRPWVALGLLVLIGSATGSLLLGQRLP